MSGPGSPSLSTSLRASRCAPTAPFRKGSQTPCATRTDHKSRSMSPATPEPSSRYGSTTPAAPPPLNSWARDPPGRALRERVLLCGGRMHAGPGDGYTLEVTLPVGSRATGRTHTRGGRGTAVIRVLLVDDQELRAQGFSRLLRDVGDIEVVGEAADGCDRRDTSPADQTRRRADGRANARDGWRRGHRSNIQDTPSVRVLMLTTFDLDEAVHRALEAGASGLPTQGHALRPANPRHPGRVTGRLGARTIGHPATDRIPPHRQSSPTQKQRA